VSRPRYRRQTTSQRRSALIGIAAILLQAILFGWHHHAVAFKTRGSPVKSLYSTTQPFSPAAAEELCEICVVLHHQSASPPAFVEAPTQSATLTANDVPAPVFLDRSLTRGFDARAPPDL
jgi:hypothetical protein